MYPFHHHPLFLFGFMEVVTREDLLKSHGAQRPPSRRERRAGTGHGSLLTDDLDLESAAVRPHPPLRAGLQAAPVLGIQRSMSSPLSALGSSSPMGRRDAPLLPSLWLVLQERESEPR